MEPTTEQLPPTTTEEQPPVNPLANEQDKMFVFSDCKSFLDRLVSDWKSEVDATEQRRLTRKVEIDVQALRSKGQLDEDETLIPVRVIDTNIKREQPPFINYLKNSRRICTFDCIDDPEQESDLVETEFTKKVTYNKWETPHFKCLDGSQAHGWATIEVVYDESKPGHVGLEYVAHDKLFFPRSVSTLEQAARIVRVYDVTLIQLRSWVQSFGFDQEQVRLLVESIQETQKEIETVQIYKLLFKHENVIYVSWFALGCGVNDWLKKPVKHFIGIKNKRSVTKLIADPMTGLEIPQQTEEWVDEDLTEYPFFLLPYAESEEEKETDKKGRVFLDANKQEAQTAILSGFVNSLTRASNLYGAPKQEDGNGSSLKELSSLRLKSGTILNKPFDFWQPPMPDALILKALQWFDLANSQENNQVNFAAMNREDSRKTATEVGAAQEERSLLNSVQLTLFSTHIRSIYGMVWRIMQSQALQNKISFLLTKRQVPMVGLDQQPLVDPQTGQPVTQESVENNYEVIGKLYDVRAAGDVDVIQRQERVQQMMQDWPVMQNTPLRDRFLSDLVKLKYPDVGEEYSKILLQMGMMQQHQSMIARLVTVLEGSLEASGGLEAVPDQQRADVTNMIAEAKGMAGQQQGA
jgi:hypothetical protein